MSNYAEYEDTVGFVPWMERNVLSKFRESNAKFLAALGVMLLAVLSTIGIGDEVGGSFWNFIDKLVDVDCLLMIGIGYAFRALKNPTSSLKKQTVYFLIGTVCFLFVVLSAAAIVVLYYGFGYMR